MSKRRTQLVDKSVKVRIYRDAFQQSRGASNSESGGFAGEAKTEDELERIFAKLNGYFVNYFDESKRPLATYDAALQHLSG